MDEDYIKEPEHGLLRYGPDEIKDIRKTYNLGNKEDRDKAIAIIDEWVKSQEHFVKKDYSKRYIERCLITSKGSLERTKKQIDTMCTLRTLQPDIFEIISCKDPKLVAFYEKKGFACVSTRLTKEYHRIVIIKGKPNIELDSEGYNMLFKSLVFGAEYLKTHDFNLGIKIIFDLYDTNVSNIFPHINLIELQKFVSVFTEGYGIKLKGIYIITNSKLLETFIKILKTIFSEKIASKFYAVADRKELKNLMDVDVLPEVYGGSEKSVEKLHESVIRELSTSYVEEFMKEMKKGVVDESKRKTDVFNDEYMGVPGSFRTLSLD